ncbi:proline racemase family protein [Lacicoccus qingdaonensis]|uniref:proline racemase family protein n=1 Tax=Lacicoccus qingdaonensis TaxID=576118 RepID=UPI000B841ED3|nr:proline racemase family protein [Salinicoccus qingdaonensis]
MKQRTGRSCIAHCVVHLFHIELFGLSNNLSHNISRMAGRGELKVHEEVICEGFVGGTIKGIATKPVKLGDKDGVITEITGKAFISGISNIFIDPDDPFKYGFIVE